MAHQSSLGWDLESLNKAYRQGYLAGLMGIGRNRCPYRSAVVLSAWEGGWEDGVLSLANAPQAQNARIA